MIKSKDDYVQGELTVKGNGDFVQWLIAVFLLALLVSNVYFATSVLLMHQTQIERAEERQAIYEEHAQQMQDWLAREQRVITSALDGYHTDAYDSGIERIAEQQLIAAEYQILLLQAIAQQNAVMIELMMIMP